MMSLREMRDWEEKRRIAREEELRTGSSKSEKVHPKVVFVKDSVLGRDLIFEDIGSWIKSPLALDHMV